VNPSHYGEVRRRAAALHVTVHANPGHLRAQRGTSEARGAKADPLLMKEREEEEGASRWRGEPRGHSGAHAGGREETLEWGLTLAKSMVRAGAKARAARGEAVCKHARAEGSTGDVFCRWSCNLRWRETEKGARSAFFEMERRSRMEEEGALRLA
jgi:hypothetical protein